MSRPPLCGLSWVFPSGAYSYFEAAPVVANPPSVHYNLEDFLCKFSIWKAFLFLVVIKKKQVINSAPPVLCQME